MQYEPIKKFLSRYFRNSAFLRRFFYFLLDLLLLRSWHVRKKIRNAGRALPDEAFVLDAGSGFGQYSWRMSSWFSKWHIKGVDINKIDVDDCNSFFSRAGRNDRVTFSRCDLTELNDRELYDLVISVDVMEHISDDTKVFTNFHSALKRNGRLIISTPSDQGGSDVHDDDDSSFIDEHVRDGYSREEISGKLANAGFSDIEAAYTYGPAGRISWIISMKYPVKLLNISYLFFIILPFYYIVALPFALALNLTDLHAVHKTGSGLLVTAVKKN